jgi:hypothetical protein
MLTLNGENENDGEQHKRGEWREEKFPWLENFNAKLRFCLFCFIIKTLKALRVC